MSNIVSIATQAAPHSFGQKEIYTWMADRLSWNETEERRNRFMYERSGISTRHSVLPDFLPDNLTILYNRHYTPSVQERLKIFNREAMPLAARAARKCIHRVADPQSVTHIITVSCTGMSAPGLDIELVKELGLSSRTERSSVNFMGCYAAIHALKQAHYITSSRPDALVLVVSVELCTLHFQELNDEDNTLANMLFADGAAAVLVAGKDVSVETNRTKLAFRQFHTDLLLSGKEDMSWNISDVGFRMTLSSYVPKIISADIRTHYTRLLEQQRITTNEVGYWAVHPGGKAILEAVSRQMTVKDDQLRASYEVLKQHGNMSSATILFVLEEIVNNDVPESGDKIVATAFGPGLTVESVLLETL